MHNKVNGKIMVDLNHARKEFKEINQLIEEIIISEIEPKIYDAVSKHAEWFLERFNYYHTEMNEIYLRCIEQRNVYEHDADDIFELLSKQGYLGIVDEAINFINKQLHTYVNKELNTNKNITQCFITLMEIVNGFKLFGLTKEHNMLQLMLKQINTKINNYLNLVIDEVNVQYIDIINYTKHEIIEICHTKMLEIIKKYNSEDDISCESIKKVFNQLELEKMTKNKGYSLARQTGSHRIYKNENGKNIIIPFHKKEIGKGLSIKIQKELIAD